LTHLALLLTVLASASPAASTPAPARAPITVSADSATAATLEGIRIVKIAYRAAWAQRQVGDYIEAAETANETIEDVDALLEADMNSMLRMELASLRTRLQGLASAAKSDHESELAAEAAGNQADDSVLNAPAGYEIEAQMNPEVERWLTYYTTTGRKTFERWWTRSGLYMDLFQTTLRREGVPPDLAHLVFVESGFNVRARSYAAAVGPWQFLRSTGRLFGLTVNQWIDERQDPEKSTVAAARYLKHLYTIFGDWPLALASYNAGEGRLLRAIKMQGTTNYWDLHLPRQTEDYVPQFMAVLHIGRNPEKYGFDQIEREPPLAFDEIALDGGVDLNTIARLCECSVERLRDLNPGVLLSGARGAQGITTLRVPVGTGAMITAKLESGDAPKQKAHLAHTVRKGETLSGIASRHKVSANLLALENKIGKKNYLRIGQELKIPTSMAPPKLASLDDGDPRASTAYVPERNIRTPAQLDITGSDGDGRYIVRVKRGETLGAIAEEHGVSVADIKEWNRLTSNHVSRGMRLKVRTGPNAAMQLASSDSAAIAELRPPGMRKYSGSIRGTVRVKPGETLGSIATRHGTTVSALKRANGLRSSMIRSGQTLKIPGAGGSIASSGGSSDSHRVQRGETLGGIAKRHGTTVSAIQRANGLKSSVIKVGQRLKIPTG
jgi:membrane-bound lytic murein transglycosylase D